MNDNQISLFIKSGAPYPKVKSAFIETWEKKIAEVIFYLRYKNCADLIFSILDWPSFEIKRIFHVLVLENVVSLYETKRALFALMRGVCIIHPELTTDRGYSYEDLIDEMIWFSNSPQEYVHTYAILS